MALSRTLIRTYAAEYPDHPEHLLHVTNQRIIADIHAGLFVTLFYGILDPSTGTLTYCNAGHPPPYIISPGESITFQALRKTGLPLGISETSDWKPATAQIPADALLLLYTDGVPDALNQHGEFFGGEQMLNIIQTQMGHPARIIQDALMSRVYAFAGIEPQVDDITLMILIRSPEGRALTPS